MDTRLWHPFSQMSVTRRRELVIVRGDGIWVWDADGHRYLDATAGLWYSNVGHGRAEIREAVATQMGRLDAYGTFNDLANPPALELASRLADLAPVEGGRVFFGSGGGDGIDTAAKLARLFFHATGEPGRDHLIVRERGYHGTHGYGTSLAGMPAIKESLGELLGAVSAVPYDSVEALERRIAKLGAQRVAAVFVEPVIGAGGVYPPPPDYLPRVAELCKSHGVILIADSVISGFGRLGTWFGVERWSIEPDMIVFAKGITSGYVPLGGVIVSDRIAEPFWTGNDAPVFHHGPTYAGHPTGCAAALANLDILEGEDLVARGRELEGELEQVLRPLADHPLVAEVRAGTGLMAGVELAADFCERRSGALQELIGATRKRGVLLRPLGRTVAMSPPLTITPAELELIGAALTAALNEL